MKAHTVLFLLVATASILSVTAGAFGAPAQKPFSGEDAAYVDWAWKNCGVVATAGERSMVEKATAAGSDAFQRTYDQQYRKLIDQARDASSTKKLCETVDSLYGRSGSRFENMIAAKGAEPAERGVPVGSSSSSRSDSGNMGGGKRGGGGGGGGRRGGF